MRTLLESIAIVGPFVAVAYASVHWGAEQRPGLAERRREHGGERWTIR